MAQWGKNLNAVAQVTVEAQVQPPAWPSGLKDPVLLQLWRWSCLWLGFSPWPENILMLGVRPYTIKIKKMKKKKKERGLNLI